MATTIAELLIEIGVSVDGANKAARKIDTVTDAAEKTDKRGGFKLKSFAKGATVAFAAVATAAAGAATAIFKLVESTATAGDQAAKDAKKLGLTAEAVQELGFAAQLSGSDFGTVKTGIQAFTRTLNDATTKGTGPAAEAFEQLGIAIDDPVLATKDLEQILPLLADRFKSLPADTDKTALAMKLFSRSGAELIPLLNEGSEGIARMRQEARDLGVVISDEGAASSEQFADDLLRLKGTLTGVRNEIATALMPTVIDIINQIREWTRGNRDLIRTRVLSFVKQLIPVLTQLGKAFLFVAENLDKLIALFVGVKLAQGFTAIASGFRAMGFAAAGALGPIGLVAGALIALVPVAIEAGNQIGNALAAAGGAQRVRERRSTASDLDFTPQERQELSAATDKLREAEAASRAGGFLGGPQAALVSVRKREVEAIRERAKDRVAAEEAQTQANLQRFRAGQAETSRLEAAARIQRVGARRKGGRAAKGAKEPTEDEPVSDVTFAEALLAVKTNQADAEQLKRVIESLSKRTPSTRAIKPTVAIDFFNFEITQNFRGADAVTMGRESADAIRGEFEKATAKAGQNLAVNVVR